MGTRLRESVRVTDFLGGPVTTVGPKGRSPQQLLGMAHKHYLQWATGDGAEDEFALEVTVLRLENVRVYVSGVLMRPDDRGTAYDYAVRGLTPGYEGDSNRVRFTAAPANGADIAFELVGG